MTLNNLDHLLKKLTEKPEWVNYRQQCYLLQEWENLVGESIAPYTRPLYIRRDVLWIAVPNSVWAQTLTLQRRTLMQSINQMISPPLRDLRFSPAQWQHKSVNIAPENDFLESAIISQPYQETKKDSHPQEALESWLKVLETRKCYYSPCPLCQSPTPPEEVMRWGCCHVCFTHSSR